MPPEFPTLLTEVDVVVALVEDICLAACASALERIGVPKDRIHEAEGGKEVLATVADLQDRYESRIGQPGAPIVVFLDSLLPDLDSGSTCSVARQLCANSRRDSRKRESREPFLVYASSRHKPQDSGCFHCAVPKTFASAALQSCFEYCQQWYEQGGGQAASTPRNFSAYVSPSQTDIRGLCIGELVDRQLQSSIHKLHSNSNSSSSSNVPVSILISSPELVHAQHVQKLGKTTPIVSPASTRRSSVGNTIESLENLAPPLPPFEDVKMVSLVGRGSFGRVYLARWDVSTVALKVVKSYDQEKPSLMAFEGKLSSSLTHPNLVQTFKYAVRDIVPAAHSNALRGFELWIVQEWCNLGSLTPKIASGEIMQNGGFREVTEVAAEIASAANYLHCRSIIHGDLTPSNVLLTERRCPKGYICKVSDFGLARVLDSGASGIDTATMGTVAYMPPELFQLEGCALTKKVDVYAFGVILWQLCSSSLPFDGLQPTQVVVMVAQGASLELPDNVPEDLSATFRAAVSRQPAERPHFSQIVQDLLKIMNLR
mmetsp:Transcript_24763/g.53852  ORF Transcript_24763/g.53852 Transcript_24763/m.53852 type:complete len:543 (+) Transcript_24763:101-1729(+)